MSHFRVGLIFLGFSMRDIWRWIKREHPGTFNYQIHQISISSKAHLALWQ